MPTMGDTKQTRLGRRIAVPGATGSGKTTFTRRLGEFLGLPPIELDALFWKPNWVHTPQGEFRSKVEAALDANPDGWVCDGNYTSALGNLVRSKADSIIWLRLPLSVTFWRLLRRTASRKCSKELYWGINSESLRRAFLSRDSVLLYAATHHRSRQRSIRRALSELSPSIGVLELRSAREVNTLDCRAGARGDRP